MNKVVKDMLRMISLSVVIIFSASNTYAFNVPDSNEKLHEAKNSFIFIFNEDVPMSRVSAMASGMAKKHAATVRTTFKHVLKGFSANISVQAAARLATNPAIKYYEQNGVATITVMPEVTADKIELNGKPVAILPQSVPYGISRVGGGIDATGKHAWIIDTGIDLDHPDLNVGFGASFVVVRGKVTADDGHGHGTHVAGTIAAINNDIGVVGVAANATVHPVRVLDENGSGYIDWVLKGIDYVAANANAGDVANMSLSAKGHYQSLHDAIVHTAELGIKFSIAAGNSSDHADFYEPAHINHVNVYTISAIDALDIFADFSNYGNPPVDFSAPGVAVTSSKIGGGVLTASGTSMAAPHVAGLLLLDIEPPLNTGGTAINDPDGNADPIAHY